MQRVAAGITGGSAQDMADPWTEQEVEVAVQDYFDMLLKEIQGESYVKAEHNKNLLPKLNNRSRGSVEYKHENISAILLELGIPPIDGYKPQRNYQGLLRDVVLKKLDIHRPKLVAVANKLESEQPPSKQEVDWESALVDPPDQLPKKKSAAPPKSQKAGKIDFAARESGNRKLGRMGEEFILQYEVYRLETSGKKKLATQIEWVSEKDDSAGFDILSFTDAGNERFIEVKTTNYARSFPFFISKNEVAFSNSNQDQYALYRLFTYRTKPRFFVLPGDIQSHCSLEPRVFRASFGGAA